MNDYEQGYRADYLRNGVTLAIGGSLTSDQVHALVTALAREDMPRFTQFEGNGSLVESLTATELGLQFAANLERPWLLYMDWEASSIDENVCPFDSAAERFLGSFEDVLIEHGIPHVREFAAEGESMSSMHVSDGKLHLKLVRDLNTGVVHIPETELITIRQLGFSANAFDAVDRLIVFARGGPDGCPRPLFEGLRPRMSISELAHVFPGLTPMQLGVLSLVPHSALPSGVGLSADVLSAYLVFPEKIESLDDFIDAARQWCNASVSEFEVARFMRDSREFIDFVGLRQPLLYEHHVVPGHWPESLKVEVLAYAEEHNLGCLGRPDNVPAVMKS